VLVQVADGATNIYSDPSQGPYDGSDDTLIGVVNDSSKSVGSLQLSSNTNLFGFDSDGLCTFSLVQPGCPFGATGYEGPNTSFSNISPDASGGVVNFTTPLAPGATAYFSLEEALTATAVFPGGPSLSEQGGGPNPSQHVVTCYAGEPINCATGTFVHDFTDFAIPGRGAALNLSRSYSSAAAATDGSFGFGWTNSYGMSLAVDAAGRVTITQENGSTVSFVPNGSGGFVAPPRVLGSLVTNSDGSYTFTRRSGQISYTFSAAGRLTSETDLNGNTTTLAYTGAQLTSVADPAGRHLSFTYTGSHITEVVDPLGRTYTYGYDSGGNLESATDPAGRTYAFSYDANHLLVTMTDARGGSTTNVYDGSARVVSQTDRAGLKTTWSYSGDPGSSSGGTTTMTDPHGDVTIYNYANLELGSVVHAAGTAAAATTSYAYDAATLGRTTITDPLGRATTNTYDGQGNLTSTTNPAGQTTSYAYSGLDEITSQTTPAGETTTLSYDGAGNLTAVTDPLGHATTYTHGDTTHLGDITAVTDPDGRAKTQTFDSAGNVVSVSVSPAAGATNTTTTVYDADGEKVCQASPNATTAHVSCPAVGVARVAQTATWTYNPDGQVTSSTDAAGHTTTSTFDADGNRTSTTDPAGNVAATTYDPDNRPLSVKKGTNGPQPSTTSTAYDLPVGSGACANPVAGTTYCTTTTDPNGDVTVDVLSARDQLLAETRPGGQTTSHAYDLAGQETTRTDATGRTITYIYDSAGRQTSITYSDGTTPKVTYAYDADGRRTSMTDGTSTTTYTYDPASRMVASTDGTANVTSYSYDSAGNTTSLTYPGGKIVTRAFDSAGHLVNVTDPSGHATTFTYDADGNPTGTAYPNGDTVSTAYDAVDQVTATRAAATATPNTPLVSVTDTANADEQVTQETASGGLAGTTTYSYDAKLQLTGANGAPYSYDLAGNPTGLASGVTQTFDAADQLTSTTRQGVTTSYTSDKLGNRTAATQPTGTSYAYGYDQANRLTSVTSTTAVIPVPVIIAISPTTGPAAGGTTVTVTGTGLTGATAVHFGTQAATSVSVTSDTSLTAVSPAGTGTVDVIVTTPGGTSAVVAADRFTYSTTNPGPKPTVLAIVPPFGSTNGGQLVLIFGTNLTKVSAVHFGTKSARFQHNPCLPELILTIAPAGTGTVDVTITTPAGTSAIRSADHYTYLRRGEHPPVVKAAPNSGTSIPVASAAKPSASTPPVSVANYTYNGDGLRTSKHTTAGAEPFAWDIASAQPQLLVDGTTSLIYGPDGLPIEQIDGTGTATYFFHDQLGSTRALLAQSGSVVATFTYDAYGRTTSSTGTVRTPLLYTGAFNDEETGFYYLVNRYYDPATAQFLTVDPAFDVTLSPYGYVGNDPLNAIDPLGLFGWSNFFHRVGTAALVAGGVAAIGAGAVALCVATACIGDAAVLAGAAAGFEIGGIGMTVIGTGADIGASVIDCHSSRGYDCSADISAVGLDAFTFGVGKLFKGEIGKAIWDLASTGMGLLFGKIIEALRPPC
jgi:RHS repeat-associated protein